MSDGSRSKREANGRSPRGKVHRPGPTAAKGLKGRKKKKRGPRRRPENRISTPTQEKGLPVKKN